MGADTRLDFTALLDELLAVSQEAGAEDDGVAPPSLRVDMLEQIERLQAENLALFPDRVISEYSENGAPPQKARSTPDLQPALDDLFFLDPQTIARELGIGPQSRQDDLDRARRAFAMRYHPDRMPEEHRERAALRMQIANMLIDEAKRARR